MKKHLTEIEEIVGGITSDAEFQNSNEAETTKLEKTEALSNLIQLRDFLTEQAKNTDWSIKHIVGEFGEEGEGFQKALQEASKQLLEEAGGLKEHAGQLRKFHAEKVKD